MRWRRILTKEAAEAQQTLRLHEDQQDDGDSGLIIISHLADMREGERVMRQRAKQGLK